MEINNDRDLATAQEILSALDSQCEGFRNALRRFESSARKHADAIHRYTQARDEAAMNERAVAIRLEREAEHAELISATVKTMDVNSLYPQYVTVPDTFNPSYELILLETVEDFERVFPANHPALESQTYQILCDERDQVAVEVAMEAATAALADAQSQLLTCIDKQGEPCADCLRQVAEAASNLAQHYA